MKTKRISIYHLGLPSTGHEALCFTALNVQSVLQLG